MAVWRGVGICDIEPNLTFCIEKFWRNFEMNLLHNVCNAKATNVLQSNFIKTRHLACKINFKIRLDQKV